MPQELTIAVATAVVTALLSILTTYWAASAKIRHELMAHYDKDLFERRLTAYGELWPLTEPLARYSPPGPVSTLDVRALSENLRKWYFCKGIILSEAAREAYFSLQERLAGVGAAPAASNSEPIGGDALETLRKASRRLHTALCADIGSRKPPLIGSKR